MWPWKRREKRQSGGEFADAVTRLIEERAAGTVADTSSTAAVEAAAGSLSRALASAEVEGAPWVQQAVSPGVLAQMGRDLVRSGQSMHVIRLDGAGRVRLIPASSWHWEGSHDPASWTVRVTVYGPSTSTAWHLPGAGVVFIRWGGTPGLPYVGTGPLSWASTTARLQSETERSLADEAGGPIANLVSIPQDGGDGGEDDTLTSLKADIRTARGKALLLETVAGGWGEGRAAAPQRDWSGQRLGPMPPPGMVAAADAAFQRVLAACGVPPAMFIDADGTSQREALRRWHMNTVLPLAKIIEHELTEKLEADVKLVFDNYALDMVSRSQVVAKLTAAGVALPVALAAVGLDR